MAYTYILECVDETYYVGSARILQKRLWQHENGLACKYTAKRLPVKLVYYEEFFRIDDAFNREKQLQGWSHAKKNALIQKSGLDLHKLAECRNASHSKNIGFDSTQSGKHSPDP